MRRKRRKGEGRNGKEKKQKASEGDGDDGKKNQIKEASTHKSVKTHDVTRGLYL